MNLKNHPFAVETFFECSLVLTYAVDKKELENLIPKCLKLDTFNDQWAFIAIALVQTKDLRPKGFPAFLGNDFFLAGFRVFVRYQNDAGKNLRGLYILKSETNKSRMSFFGNIFTHYNYTTTDIEFTRSADLINITSEKSGLNIEARTGGEEITLPQNSPFKNWQEARRFAGPLPFTFTFNEKKNEVLIIEGVRQNWVPKPVQVINHRVEFLDQKAFKEITLANAFIIERIPYYWKKGKIEKWKK